jgi:hypothetical protein
MTVTLPHGACYVNPSVWGLQRTKSQEFRLPVSIALLVPHEEWEIKAKDEGN